MLGNKALPNLLNCDVYDRLEGVIEKILEKLPKTHLP